MSKKVKAFAAILFPLLLVGCDRPVDPTLPPAGMEGTWTGSTDQGHRSITFGHGTMTTTQVGLKGSYKVKYYPDDVAAPMSATLNSVQSVRVEATKEGSSQSIKLTYTVVGGVILQDAFGSLQRRQ